LLRVWIMQKTKTTNFAILFFLFILFDNALEIITDAKIIPLCYEKYANFVV